MLRLGEHQGGLSVSRQRPRQRSGDSGRTLSGNAGALRRDDWPDPEPHDTTEFSCKREDIEAVGKTRIGFAGADLDGPATLHGVRHLDASQSRCDN